MAKVRIQTRKKDAEENDDGTLPEPANTGRRRRQNEGAVDILARVLRTEGFMGWYKVWASVILDTCNWFMCCCLKGMSAQILKAVLSQGVLFMSKEQFEQYALAIIVLFYRLRVSGGQK